MKKLFLILALLITGLGFSQEDAPTRAKGGIQTPDLDSWTRLEGTTYASIRWDSDTQSWYSWNPVTETWNVFGAGSQDLETTTGFGNTTPDNIVINGTVSSYFQVADTGNFRYGHLYANSLLFSRDANNLSINTPTLTGNRNYSLRDSDVDFTGGSDGDVLTVQADGSLQLETPVGGGALDFQGTTDLGNTTTNNITTQSFTSTGTRAGGDLNILIGDYDLSSTGTRMQISSGDDEIFLFTGASAHVISEPSVSFNTTSNIILQAPTIDLRGDIKIQDVTNISNEITFERPDNFITLDRTQTWSNGNGRIEVYAGTYNATTNVPTLTNAVLRQGEYYLVSVAGSIDFGSGVVSLGVGDIVGCNDTEWYKKVDNNQGGGGTDDQTASEVTSDDATFDVITGTDVQANLVSTDNELYANKPVETADTSTTISLHTSGGNNCNFGSANSNTTYTTTGAVLNGWAQVLINASSEPTVTGATQEGGIEFVADTDMYMIVRNKGTEGVVYYFLPVTIQPSYEYSLPTGDGTANQILVTDGTGTVTWEDGTPGVDGSSVLSGSVDPTTEGVDGDFYINTTSYEIFGPKASGVWGSGTSLVGPTGATGATGANGTLAPWEGEFNKEFVFNQSTGILNQTDTSGTTYFTSNYNETVVQGGSGTAKIINFNCYPDSSNAINVIYGDFNSVNVTNIGASAVDNLPAIAAGRSRLVLGVCVRRGAGDYILYSKYFKLPKETSNRYPFDTKISDSKRSGVLTAVTDIKDIKLYINNPENLYTNGRLNKIRPNIMSNGNLFRWQMYDYEGNVLGFIGVETISSQSGIQTITLEQSPIGGTTLGITLEITMDFDLFSGTTNYTYTDNWYLDESILLEAIERWHRIENSDFTYNDVLSSLSKIKLNDGEDTGIALFGDSMWTYLTNGVEPIEGAANLPPSCQIEYTPYWLFKYAVINKPQYDRFDSAINSFTESGTFTDGDNFGAFGVKYGGELMRYSSTSSAYVEWDWDLSAHEKLNFIYAEDDGNSNNLTVTVSSGTGDVEVYNGSSWVEADGFTFDQIAEPVNASLGNLGYSFNHRLKFRRVATSGTSTIRISKGANADVLYYWGTERYNGATIWFNNEGYSANTLSQLQGKYNSSLFSTNKHTNIIIHTLPIIGESGADLTALRNLYQDYIWGDRVGFENANSLKNLSNDWVDFQVIPIIPQKTRAEFNTDGTRTSSISHRKWNMAIELLQTQGDLGYIDFNAIVNRESRIRGINRYEIVEGFTGNANDYYQLAYDSGGHFNILGCKLVSKNISPLFWY